MEEEHFALQKTLEDKRRKLQQLEAVKSLSAAQARMLVYDQVKPKEEEQKDTLQHEIVPDKRLQLQSQQLPTPTSPLSVDATPFVPQAMTTTSNDNIAELVKVLAGALSANKIPVPEPSIFSGDPLKYNDWKLSFETLIDHKNIQDKEKIYYLHQYVSGLLIKHLMVISCSEPLLLTLLHGKFWRRDMETPSQLQKHTETSSTHGRRWDLRTALNLESLLIFFAAVKRP